MTAVDPHRLTGAYALHALSDAENGAFERHLTGCEECARETAEFTATAARLGLAVSAAPSPGLRERVLNRISGVRQVRPGPIEQCGGGWWAPVRGRTAGVRQAHPGPIEQQRRDSRWAPMRGRITGARQMHPRPIEQQQRRDTRWAPVLSRITGARQKRGDPIEQRHDGPRAPMLRRVARVRQKRTDPISRPRSGPRAPALSRWALAACLAVAAVSGGGALWQHQRAEDARDRARGAVRAVDAIAAVLAAPDARTRATGLAGGATGSVVVSRELDRAVLLVTGMGRPPGGKVYQLWFDEDGTMRPAGLMDPGRADQAVLLRGAVDGASGMGITVESEGGSGRPTSTPVAVLAFPG